jgi:hypothetical protein
MTFADRIRKLIIEARAVPKATAARVVEILDAQQKALLGELASAKAGSFQAARLRGMLFEVQRRMNEFRDQAVPVIQRAQEDSFAIGAKIAKAPAPHMVLGGLDRAQLVVAQEDLAERIGGLTSNARRRLSSAIRRSFIGGKSADETFAEVSRAIGGTGSVFDEVAYRAVRIVHTDTLLMTSIGTQARMEQMAERVPELQRKWRHSTGARVPRPSHLAMDGQIRGVNEPFVTPDGIELMYPRDPNAPAEETVECHCVVVPFIARKQEAA